MKLKKIYFVSGIDTGVGKTVVTGVLAREWAREGVRVMTQKFIQTGCVGISEDILEHRRLMGIDLLPEDREGVTSPQIFSYPASPHLAARIDQRTLSLEAIRASMDFLSGRYDTVLLEGAGGLHVPLDDEGYTTLDFVQESGLPVILVTSPRLGSINHTLLSLEVCRNRGIEVDFLVYNLYPETSELITADTRNYLQRYLLEYHPHTRFLELDSLYCLKELSEDYS